MAWSAPTSQAPPRTPPAPRTRPTRGDCVSLMAVTKLVSTPPAYETDQSSRSAGGPHWPDAWTDQATGRATENGGMTQIRADTSSQMAQAATTIGAYAHMFSAAAADVADTVRRRPGADP